MQSFGAAIDDKEPLITRGRLGQLTDHISGGKEALDTPVEKVVLIGS